tara:strand:+ start:754 stop:2598 length:1845 start_codon:yes stop_codon:yes gene_type:complete
MSDYEKYLKIVDVASELTSSKESLGDKAKSVLKTIFTGLKTKKEKENADRIASQTAQAANTFDIIKRELDARYDSFNTAELDKVNKIGMEAFLNSYAEEQFNNMDWSQDRAIKWEDRNKPELVNKEMQDNMIQVFNDLKTNKRDHIKRLQADPRAMMEKPEFSQKAIDALNARKLMIANDPKNLFLIPKINENFEKIFGKGSSAYEQLVSNSKKADKELEKFLESIEGLDEKITFDYGAIINDTESSDEEKQNIIRMQTTPISASSIETKAGKLESKLYSESKGKKIVREEVEEMIKNQPLLIPFINYNRQFTIEDFKKIEADQPQTSIPFNFYKKFIENEIKVLNPDGSISTSSNEQFLNIVAKNILERQKRAVANGDENATMLLGTSGLNTVIASFANEGRFVLGSNIKVNENAISPDLKIEDGDIVFISPSLTNRIDKDKISVNEIIDSKSEEEPSDGFDRAGFTDTVIDAISNGEIKQYQAVMLKAHPEHTNYINKTINTLLDLTTGTTKTNNLAEEMQNNVPKTIADVDREAIPFGEIARGIGKTVSSGIDFFNEKATEFDFERLQDYVERGDKAAIINLPRLLRRYNLPENATPADVKKFLEEQELQN